jgi:hypothetical protein
MGWRKILKYGVENMVWRKKDKRVTPKYQRWKGATTNMIEKLLRDGLRWIKEDVRFGGMRKTVPQRKRKMAASNSRCKKSTADCRETFDISYIRHARTSARPRGFCGA